MELTPDATRPHMVIAVQHPDGIESLEWTGPNSYRYRYGDTVVAMDSRIAWGALKAIRADSYRGKVIG